jgi:hypothetical protein
MPSEHASQVHHPWRLEHVSALQRENMRRFQCLGIASDDLLAFTPLSFRTAVCLVRQCRSPLHRINGFSLTENHY